MVSLIQTYLVLLHPLPYLIHLEIVLLSPQHLVDWSGVGLRGKSRLLRRGRVGRVRGLIRTRTPLVGWSWRRLRDQLNRLVLGDGQPQRGRSRGRPFDDDTAAKNW